LQHLNSLFAFQSLKFKELLVFLKFIRHGESCTWTDDPPPSSADCGDVNDVDVAGSVGGFVSPAFFAAGL